MKIIKKNIYLLIRILQNILPLYFIIFLLYIKRAFVQIYINYKIFCFAPYFRDPNYTLCSICKKIKIIKLNKKIIIYNYNKLNKSMLIINGGGLISIDLLDIVVIKNILPIMKNYNIIVIKYDLLNKYSETLKDIITTFEILLRYNINIDIFIGNSIGCTLLLDLFNVYKQFKNKKLILISPIVNYDIKYNENVKKDIININFFNNIKNKYYDNIIDIDYDNLPNILIICSTNEIFYYDIINFYKKCKIFRFTSKKKTEIYYIKNGIHSEYTTFGLFNNNKIKEITNRIIHFIK